MEPPPLDPPGSVDAKTGLMLINAIYFKGKWETPFDERCTEVRNSTSSTAPPWRRR